MHYARYRRTGNPVTVTRTSTLDSFWSRVDKCAVGGHWLWTGPVLPNGYGQIVTRKRLTASGTRLAHRVCWELIRGPIPEGLVLDHLCRVLLCVNPDDLEPVELQENVRRGLHGVLRTHCKYGHELVGDNVLYDHRRNCRRCRTCQRSAEGRYKARRRAATAWGVEEK